MAYVPDEAIERSHEISGGAYRLYTYYCKRTNARTGICFPSLKCTADDTRMDYTRASRWRKELAAAGWIELEGDVVTPLMGFIGANKDCQKGNGAAVSASREIAETAKPLAETATTFAETANAYRKNQPMNQPIEPKSAPRARAQGLSQFSVEEIMPYLADRTDLRSKRAVAEKLHATGEDDQEIAAFLERGGRKETKGETLQRILRAQAR